MTPAEQAKSFMDLVYERIKHGDAEHQQWLKDECIKLEGSLLAILETTTCKLPHYGMLDGETPQQAITRVLQAVRADERSKVLTNR